MQGLLKLGLISLLVGGSLTSYAAQETSKLPPNMMACEQVLKLSSTEFVDKYTQVHGDNTLERINAIYQYGNCYSQNLDNLQAQMNKSGRHPLMGANANFRDFEKALDDFTTTTLNFCSPDGTLSRVTAAYATLYQQQFRHLFYQQYLLKSKITADNPKAIKAAKAKLDEVIKALPKDQIASATQAFTAYYDAAVKALKLPALPVYEYAIMLLQSPADKPYSPPPF